MLKEAFQQVTELDGKLLRSLRLLLFRPGVLSREYIDDRRVRYASPISLFLLANVLYFFSPAMSDFNLPFADQVPGPMAVRSLDPSVDIGAVRRQQLARNFGQAHSRWTAPLVERKLKAGIATHPGYDMHALAQDYDREAGIVGKVLIVVHVPIMALALALVLLRKRRYFVEHFVVALHLFTFLLLYAQLLLTPMNWIATRAGIDLAPAPAAALKLFLTGVVLAYMLLACRRAYGLGWGWATAGLFAALFGLLFANLWIYRALQFLVTLALV
ncbi:MAG: DUF3667 domain-containing protein [Arenimonas sp.]